MSASILTLVTMMYGPTASSFPSLNDFRFLDASNFLFLDGSNFDFLG